LYGGNISIYPGAAIDGLNGSILFLDSDFNLISKISKDYEKAPFEVYTDGYFANNLTISGKLTVDGLIDPTGLVLTSQVSSPTVPELGKATIWCRESDGYCVITDGYGRNIELTGSGGAGIPGPPGPAGANAASLTMLAQDWDDVYTGYPVVTTSTIEMDSLDPSLIVRSAKYGAAASMAVTTRVPTGVTQLDVTYLTRAKEAPALAGWTRVDWYSRVVGSAWSAAFAPLNLATYADTAWHSQTQSILLSTLGAAVGDLVTLEISFPPTHSNFGAGTALFIASIDLGWS
jgi:hypothetical protein